MKVIWSKKNSVIIDFLNDNNKKEKNVKKNKNLTNLKEIRKLSEIFLSFGFVDGTLLFLHFKKQKNKKTWAYNKNIEKTKNLELPISSLEFFENSKNYVNLIVGTTLGYLVVYKNLMKNYLNEHIVINNNFLQESIIDVLIGDFNSDGRREILVYYFNKIIQFYQIDDDGRYDFINEIKLDDFENFPFKLFIINADKNQKKLLFFAPNYLYEYDFLF